eukprot:GHVQ01015785.1.p1 GENE.GHVQ01015785.1~~GHVQ01015785.1.p1  ORF type:complete len:947 (-),score=87.34 GHVQ01015785.1:1968-4808(-)
MFRHTGSSVVCRETRRLSASCSLLVNVCCALYQLFVWTNASSPCRRHCTLIGDARKQLVPLAFLNSNPNGCMRQCPRTYQSRYSNSSYRRLLDRQTVNSQDVAAALSLMYNHSNLSGRPVIDQQQYPNIKFPPPAVLNPPESLCCGFDSPLIPPQLPGYPPPRSPVPPSYFAPEVNEGDIFVTAGTILGKAAPVIRLHVATERGVSPYLLADDWFTRRLIGGRLLNLAIFEYMRLTFKRTTANEVVNRCKDILLSRETLSKIRFIYNPYVVAWEEDNKKRFPYVPVTEPPPPIDECFFRKNPFLKAVTDRPSDGALYRCGRNHWREAHDEAHVDDEDEGVSYFYQQLLEQQIYETGETYNIDDYPLTPESDTNTHYISSCTAQETENQSDKVTMPSQPYTLISEGYGSNGLIRPEYRDYLLKYWASRVIAYVGIYPNERVNVVANALRAAGYGSPHDIMVEIRDGVRPLHHRGGEHLIRKYFCLHDLKKRNAQTANAIVPPKHLRERAGARRAMEAHALESSIISSSLPSLSDSSRASEKDAKISDDGLYLEPTGLPALLAKVAKQAKSSEDLDKIESVSKEWLASVSSTDIHLPGVVDRKKGVHQTKWPAVCKIVHPPPKPTRLDPLPDLKGSVNTCLSAEESMADRRAFEIFIETGSAFDDSDGEKVDGDAQGVIEEQTDEYSNEETYPTDLAKERLWWMRRGILVATLIRQLSMQCQQSFAAQHKHLQVGEIAASALSGIAGSSFPQPERTDEEVKLSSRKKTGAHRESGSTTSTNVAPGGLSLMGLIHSRVKKEMHDLIFGRPVLLSREFTEWIVQDKIEAATWGYDPRHMRVSCSEHSQVALQYYGADGADKLLKHRREVLDFFARQNPEAIGSILVAMRKAAGFPRQENLIAAVLRLCHQIRSPRVSPQGRMVLKLQHFCNSGYGDPLDVILEKYSAVKE